MKKLIYLIAFLTCIGASAQYIDASNTTVVGLTEKNTDSIMSIDGEGKMGYTLKSDIAESIIVEDIAELEAYDGEATTLIVKDSIRGGIFTKHLIGTVDDTFVYEAANSGVWLRQVPTDVPVNVLWNPNIDNVDKEHDNREGLMQVYNSAVDRGFTKVYHPEGFYYSDSTLVAPPNLHYYGAGKGKTIISFDGNGDDTGINIEGSYEFIGELSQEAFKNNDSIVLASPVNLLPNDILIVTDTTESSYGFMFYREGEFALVKDSINSNTVTLQSGLLAREYSAGTNIYKVAKNWAKITDMSIVGNRTIPPQPSPTTPPVYELNRAINLRLLQNVELRGLEVSNINSHAINMENLFQVEIKENVINQTYLLEDRTGTEISKQRYGLTIAGCQNMEIINNEIYANRHAIDMADNSKGYLAEVSLPLIPRNINIENNRLTSLISSSANSHVSEYVVYTENYILGGMNIYGDHYKILNNEISVGDINDSYAISARAIGTDYQVSGNLIKGKNDIYPSAINVVFNSDFTTINTGVFRIENNTFKNEVETGVNNVIRIINLEGDTSPDINFTGNKIYNNSNFSSRVQIQGNAGGFLGNLNISDNYFRNLELYVPNVNNIEIKSNTFDSINNSAIYADNFEKLKITGNSITSNIESGATTAENSAINVSNGTTAILNENVFDAPNNEYNVNAENIENLTLGSYYQISGVSDNNISNSTEKSFVYPSLEIEDTLRLTGSSATILVNRGTLIENILLANYLPNNNNDIGTAITSRGAYGQGLIFDLDYSNNSGAENFGIRFNSTDFKIFLNNSGFFSIGGSTTPREMLDVQGNGIFDGTVVVSNATQDDEAVNLGQVNDTLSNYTLSSLLSTVATSGSYNDLSDTPTIPAQVNLTAGSDIDITGTYPNLTISATGGGATELNDLSDVDVDGGQADGDVLRWVSGTSAFETYTLGTMADEDVDDYYTQTQVNDTLSNYPLYDEGSFAGTIAGSISGTVDIGDCNYVRIGNQVTVWVAKAFSTAGLEGEIRFLNLPYSAVEPVHVTVNHDGGDITLGSDNRVILSASGSEAGFYFYPSDTPVEDTDIAANVVFVFQLTYLTDDAF